ncbi:hypothetical protein JD844_017203 [Phrynosoma platyrhinos]|uniref:Uncharacterized protein n=1 Tax=Phrynosoma platyrhinos TaxID=52577 RepID=A0ABQ7SLL4_PHRPL|nr:hypothetical protein JD844_017203 [Phrynosoma platyrhinos]
MMTKRDIISCQVPWYPETGRVSVEEWEKKGHFLKTEPHAAALHLKARQEVNTAVGRLNSDNITCYSPAFVHGLRMLEEAQEQLHYKCYIHFDDQDYLFLGLVGFCIFSAGTVLAWLLGICAVIYEFLTANGEDNEDEE